MIGKHKTASEQTAPSSVKPTTAQLANLAAALSKEKEEPEWLVKYALALWEAANELLTKPQPPQAEPERTSEPKPKGYPVKLDEFLRLVLPHLSGRTAVKNDLFREYLKFRLRNSSPPNGEWDDKMPGHNIPADRIPFDCCHPRIVPATRDRYLAVTLNTPNNTPEPTKDDVDKRLALWQTNPIPDPNSFYYHVHWFRSWYQTVHTADVSAKRRASGAKGLVKNREKKKGRSESNNPDKRKGARPHRKKEFQKILQQALRHKNEGLDTLPP